MGRPKLSADVVYRIKHWWGENPKRSATQVHRLMRQQGHAVSLRKVQQVIAEARRKMGGRQRPMVEWKPWKGKLGTSQDCDYLLRLDAKCLDAMGRHLFELEAKWARRIRVAVEGLNLWHQLYFVFMYAKRELAADNLQEPSPYTTDLDGMLAYKCWLPQGSSAYDSAVLKGLVPPLVDSDLYSSIRSLQLAQVAALAKQRWMQYTVPK